MVEIRTAMEEKGLAVRPPADDATLKLLRGGFVNPLPDWLLSFLAVQDGMSLGPIVGVNPFTRERLSFSPEWIVPATQIGERSAIQNSSGNLECVVLGEFESDLIVEFLDGPLKGYVALICHDRDPRMLCRAGISFLQQTLECVIAGIRDPSVALKRIRFTPGTEDAATAARLLTEAERRGRPLEALLMRELAAQMLPGAGQRLRRSPPNS